MPQHTNAVLRVSLLGSLRLERGGETLRLPTRKIESLLGFLVLHPASHPREKLAALLWGDVTDEQARGSLRKALTLLRATLGQAIVTADRQTVQLDPAYPLWTDVSEFDRESASREWGTVEQMDRTARQLDALYRGDLLADLYDDWILPLREAYRERHVQALLTLAQSYRAHSEYNLAIPVARRVLSRDPANERAHQHLMFCYVGLGDRQAALKQYAECVRALREELGVPPSRESDALHQWIRQFTAERTPGLAPISNLPLPFSSFVGRRRETATLKQVLTTGTRLVTLTGPGGSGKTRLANQTAADLVDQFPDGVWWVELAALSDPSNIVRQIAKTVGVREAPPDPLLVTLQHFLSDKHLLLVLDNCEHVLEASAGVANDLLLTSPHLYILTTSRQALHLTGEQVVPVPTLSVPSLNGWTYTDLLREYEGIRLFVERARALDPGFELTEQNGAAVAQICARLDGIPLALELAASRVTLLTVHEIAARLDARFDLLKDGNRAAPPRHQTLRAVLDWSCELLDQAERVLWRRMSVFAGSFTLAALEHVVTGGEVVSVFDTLSHLVEKSLVVKTARGSITRYGMLETVQQYAREMLAAAGEQERQSNLHLHYFVQYAERAEREFRSSAQLEWLALFDAELDNVRAALSHAVAFDPAAGLQLAGSLEWFWNLRGHWKEGPDWLERLLTSDAHVPAPVRARALTAGANLYYWSGIDEPKARAWLEQAIALYRAAHGENAWGLGYALALYGEALRNDNQGDAARAPLGEALQIARSLGGQGKWIAAWAYMTLGGLADPANIRHVHLEAGCALARELGDDALLQVILARAGWFYIRQGQFDRAQERALEALQIAEQIGDRLGVAWLYKLLGDVAFAQQDSSGAKEHFHTSLEIFTQLGNKAGMRVAQESLDELS